MYFLPYLQPRPAPIFKKEHCSWLDKAPYVCNGCDRRFTASLSSSISYNAHFADRKYPLDSQGLRSGISITKHELHQKIDHLPLIEQGQSPYQIAVNHPELGMSVARTIYTYIDKGLSLFQKH